MWVCFPAFATGYYLVFIFTVQAYNSPYVADWEGRYVTGLPLSYSQHQTSGMFSSNVWGKSYDLCDIRLSQKMAGELLWGKPISRPAAGIEAKGLVCILAKSKHRSQELQWLRIPLPAPWPNSAFYLWVKPLHACTQLAFLPPHATPTHPAGTQIMRFEGTSSPSSEILWSYHKEPDYIVTVTLVFSSLEFV